MSNPRSKKCGSNLHFCWPTLGCLNRILVPSTWLFLLQWNVHVISYCSCRMITTFPTIHLAVSWFSWCSEFLFDDLLLFSLGTSSFLEDVPWFSYDFQCFFHVFQCFPWFPMFSHDVPMFSYDFLCFLHVFPPFSHYFPMIFHVFPRFSQRFSMFSYDFQWFFHDFPMIFPCVPTMFPCFPTISHDFPMFPLWLPAVFQGMWPSSRSEWRSATPSLGTATTRASRAPWPAPTAPRGSAAALTAAPNGGFNGKTIRKMEVLMEKP